MHKFKEFKEAFKMQTKFKEFSSSSKKPEKHKSIIRSFFK